MEYSIHDALRAGFNKVVFIIKPEMEEMMERLCGYLRNKTAKDGSPVEVAYAFQDFSSVPDFYRIPAERTKPFGTVHALLCAADVVDGPCCVINADDYYGIDAYRTIYEELVKLPAQGRATMVGYQLKNTLTDKGSVARGLCVTDEKGFLTEIVERTRIIRTEDGAAYTEDDGATYTSVSADTLVSMNMWAFYPSIFELFEKAMDRFFAEEVAANPMKAECLIPTEVGKLLEEKKATVEMLSSRDKWFGVTYQEDKPFVKESIQKLKDAGVYPDKLWT